MPPDTKAKISANHSSIRFYKTRNQFHVLKNRCVLEGKAFLPVVFFSTAVEF